MMVVIRSQVIVHFLWGCCTQDVAARSRWAGSFKTTHRVIAVLLVAEVAVEGALVLQYSFLNEHAVLNLLLQGIETT